MSRDRTTVQGRDAELTALRAASASGDGRLVVVRGPAGIGRSALLDAVGQQLRADGVRVLPLCFGAGAASCAERPYTADGSGGADEAGGSDCPENAACSAGADGDVFGIARTVCAVRARFEEFDDVGLADSLSSVVRLSEAAGRDAEGWAARMATELGLLFERIGRRGRTAILVDDAHTAAEPAPLLDAARRSGSLVVATCRDGEPTPGTAELTTVADEVLDLGPLADETAEELVRRAAGRRLDDTVTTGLRTALGPLFTNPGTLLGTFADLWERDRLTVFRGRLCLRLPMESIELPAGHELLEYAGELGGEAPRVLEAVALCDNADVDGLPLLAEAFGARLDDVGVALDRLIAAGVLTARPDGRLSCRCPALAASAAARAGALGGARLHAALARCLLARHRQGDDLDCAELADHLALGGPVAPLDGETVAWLLGLSEAAAPLQPERAAQWCAAALRRMPATGTEHTEALARLTTLVARSGRYDLLREPLTRYAAEGCAPASLPRMRLAAMLVALHTGLLPPEEPVRALLDGKFLGNERTGFAEWWFGGSLTAGADPAHPLPPASAASGTAAPQGPPDAADAPDAAASSVAPPDGPGAPGMRVLTTPGSPSARNARIALLRPEVPEDDGELISDEHIDVLRSALDDRPDACRSAWQRAGWPPSPEQDRLQRAASVIDVSTMAKIVFGERYRVPADGVLGTYSRVVRGHAGGDWSQAMSAVRELELSGARETLVHHPARLFAADVCAARREFQQAAEWLAEAARLPRFAALRVWARIGLLSCTGEDARAVRLAVHACRWLSGAGRRPGMGLLLMRAVRTAVFIDDHEAAQALLEMIEHAHREGAWTNTEEDVFTARVLVRRTAASLDAAAELTRERGDLPSLLEFCLAAARFADDPRPWLREAHGLAARCGASALLERIRTVTRERGVPAPRSRGQRQTPADNERRIIELIREGMTNRQIALQLQVSEKTVEYCLTRLFARTGCRSRVELVAASLDGRLSEDAGGGTGRTSGRIKDASPGSHSGPRRGWARTSEAGRT